MKWSKEPCYLIHMVNRHHQHLWEELLVYYERLVKQARTLYMKYKQNVELELTLSFFSTTR